VYRHCLFCQRDLGANDVVEELPIGRRLAFDEAKGRLWVICRACERWNLTPFDSRWEAIEQCEREFRSTKLRASTGNVGLARLNEGLELVRIGAPMRPEMAAWRYGDQFGRRRRKHAIVLGGSLVAVGGLFAGATMAGAGGFMAIHTYVMLYRFIVDRFNRVSIRTADGRIIRLSASKLRTASVQNDAATGQVELLVGYEGKRERWFGDEAKAIARIVVPRVNVSGAGKAEVQRAVELISGTSLTDDPLGWAIGHRPKGYRLPHNLGNLSTPQRLALEMALHEEHEIRALHGELKALEDEWRAAEEIAMIADSLTVSSAVEEQLAALKSRQK
jgi:hypothetical protein